MTDKKKHFTNKVLYQWGKATVDLFLIEEFLVRFGWKIKKCGKHRDIKMYESPCGKYIIKKSLLCYYGIPSKISIPTRRKSCWLLQPIADVSEAASILAWAEISLYKDHPKYENVDFSKENVGLYQEKAVIFDW